MIKAKIKLYDGYKDIEFAEIQDDSIIDKTRFKVFEGDEVFVFAKINKKDCYSGKAYIVMLANSKYGGESITLDSDLVRFKNEEDENKVPCLRSITFDQSNKIIAFD